MNTLQLSGDATSFATIAHWLSPAEVADKLGVTSTAVVGWVKVGFGIEGGRLRLPATKVGGRWRIDPAAVPPFLNAMTRASLPASASVDTVPVDPPKESPAKARKRVAETMASLRALGLGVLPPPRRRARS